METLPVRVGGMPKKISSIPRKMQKPRQSPNGKWGKRSPSASPNNERNSVPSTADRVNEYHQNLSEFRSLQSLVSLPRFNVDHYPDVCIRLNELSQKLKDEADALFDLHVNVY